jgi:DNA invertase Pin-like site-specific DNA recombinase
MKRAALYARVSTDKQEREETIESQLDALYHAVEAGAYEIPPGGVSIVPPWIAYGIWRPKGCLRRC